MTFGWSYTMGAACPVMMKMIIFILWLSSEPVQTSIIQKQLLWYKPHPRTWKDARATCKSEHNGDLAMATASLTVNEMNQMYMAKYYAWIGLRKNGSTWYWDKGTDVVQVHDNFKLPNGPKECGQALYQTSRPVDDDCKNLHFFYCEKRYSNLIWSKTIFVPQTKTWEGAKSYCVKQGNEFTAVTWDNDLKYNGSPFNDIRNFPVWIGQYQNGDCGVIWSQNKTWLYQNCSEAFPFLCSSNNLLLVQDLLTWEQSYHHCKSHAPGNYSSYRLVSGDTLDLQFIQFVASNAATDKVWLGLRFIGGSWFWSDGAVLSLPDLTSCPEPNLHCGALVVNRLSSTSKPTIEPSDCSEKLNLICYGL